MWLITTFGFFSIVQKPSDQGEETLTVRARVRGDSEELVKRHLAHASPILEHAGSDYRYRTTAPRAEVAVAVLEAVRSIDYSNFKSSVAVQQGAPRAHLYGKVWETLRGMQSEGDGGAKHTNDQTRL